jgi:hypothetical protein
VIPVPSGVLVWLAVGRTDMRKGMNGLALQVGIGRHTARSNVQAGNSSQRFAAPSREQRRTVPSAFSIASWTRTRHPTQGCQG